MSIYENLSEADVEAMLLERATARGRRLVVAESAGRWVAAFTEERRFRGRRPTLIAEREQRRDALVQLLRHDDVTVYLGDVRRRVAGL